MRRVHPAGFAPSPDMAAWLRSTFIDRDGPLANDDHMYLRHASVGVLWTNEEHIRKCTRTLGRASLGEPKGSDAWKRLRREVQIKGWFGGIPDFIITLDARWFMQANNIQRCALIEHELTHCSPQQDPFGGVKFSRSTGKPRWQIRKHDSESFAGVVRRYGAWNEGLRQVQAAMEEGPTIGQARIDGLCGTCLKKVA